MKGRKIGNHKRCYKKNSHYILIHLFSPLFFFKIENLIEMIERIIQNQILEPLTENFA